jgi:hypothetical protein
MFTRVFLSLALLVAMPAWSQVSTTDGGVGLAMTDQMRTPPPVNGEAYSTVTGSEIRSNFLRAGLVFTTGYSDNVLGYAVNPVSDVDYSIYPTIAIDKLTSRLRLRLNYSPGFTFYQHTSALNQWDQNLALNFQYRVSPHVTVTLQDSLLETSSVLNANPLAEGGVSASPQAPVIAVISPVGDQLSNSGNAKLTYQFAKNGMIGVSGAFTNLHYLNSSEVPGLYDSKSTGGSAFYNHRLSGKHYIGATYQYSDTFAYPVNALTEVQTNTFLFFYTIYLKPTFSLSFSGGPQHYNISQSPLPTQGAWGPTLSASLGWQGRHTNYSASYLRVVTGGGGLVGAFQSNIVNGFARWQFARTWSLGSAVSYANNKNVTPSAFLSTEGGYSVFGTVSFQHQFTERFQVAFGYTRLHESYSFIPVISHAPNTDRGFVSFSYNFSKPLGG